MLRPKPSDILRSEDSAEIAAYIEAMTRDLSNIARRNGMETLAYLLDVAKLEAQSVGRLHSSDQ